MQPKGSSGSRRWIARQSVDTRPIISDYDVPRWQRRLEAIAPIGCYAVAGATLLMAAMIWGADLLAGHIR